MEEDNPIGSYCIKLARFMIEFNRSIVKRFKRENIVSKMSNYFARKIFSGLKDSRAREMQFEYLQATVLPIGVRRS